MMVEEYSNNDYRYYLAHHQIKGAKWGVHNGPPYPLSSVISTGKRLKNAINTTIGSVKKKKDDIKNKIEAKQEKKKEIEKQNKDAEIKKIIASGDAKQIDKIKNQLSTSELLDAVNRAELNKRLHNADYSLTKFEKVMSGINRATTYTKTGIEAWNTFARIVNSQKEPGDKRLKTI